MGNKYVDNHEPGYIVLRFCAIVMAILLFASCVTVMICQEEQLAPPRTNYKNLLGFFMIVAVLIICAESHAFLHFSADSGSTFLKAFSQFLSPLSRGIMYIFLGLAVCSYMEDMRYRWWFFSGNVHSDAMAWKNSSLMKIDYATPGLGWVLLGCCNLFHQMYRDTKDPKYVEYEKGLPVVRFFALLLALYTFALQCVVISQFWESDEFDSQEKTLTKGFLISSVLTAFAEFPGCPRLPGATLFLKACSQLASPLSRGLFYILVALGLITPKWYLVDVTWQYEWSETLLGGNGITYLVTGLAWAVLSNVNIVHQFVRDRKVTSSSSNTCARQEARRLRILPYTRADIGTRAQQVCFPWKTPTTASARGR